jgi:tRNA pseudouridine13 synthase
MYEIKKQPEDFIVEEITREGNILSINGNYFFDDKSNGRELICVLIKKNWDTLLALKEISKRLHISRNRIGFAGTKDKKAITSQLISLSGVKKEEAEQVKIKDIQLKPLYYSNERISLGYLKGNHFKIKVYSDKEPREATVIPNYFGVQRFGKTRPITHLVGKKIIEGKPEEAVMIYLTESFEGEKEEVRKAREKLRKEKDFKNAFDYFPFYLKYERSLIGHLIEYPGDFIGALRILPKTLKLMFVHAYQSYLFNKMLDYAVKYKIKVDELPLVGYGSKLNDWQKEILKKEGIGLDNFHVKFLPELSAEGLMRKAFIELNDLKITRGKKEEYLLEFSLPKGTYATTVIDFLFNV